MLTNKLLSEQHAEHIAGILLGGRFPNYYRANINSGGITDRYENEHTATGFSHNYFDDGAKQSDALDVVMPYLWALLDRNNLILENLLRARSVLTFPMGMQHEGFPHIDMTALSNYKTAIVYVAGLDGDTILYNEMFDGNMLPDPKNLTELCRITPVPNSGIVFDGHRYHTGLLPETSKVRLVLNFNFTIKEKSDETE